MCKELYISKLKVKEEKILEKFTQ